MVRQNRIFTKTLHYRTTMIYLDNNATTRVDERVLQSMLPYFTKEYGNAASSHLQGMAVNEAVENARESVAALIGAKPGEIIFTSGATESVNLAIKGLLNSSRKHIVTVATEHKAVLDTCRYMEAAGFTVSCLPVNRSGLVNLEQLGDTVTEDTALVCVMLANNETGVIQPVKEIAAMAHAKGALFMSDATQAVGKIAVDVKNIGVDLMPFSAHKFYGPKGIGALYISADAKIKLQPQLHGGGHQRGMRSGTLNVPGIIGLAMACEIAGTDMEADTTRLTVLRDKLESVLLEPEGASVNGSTESRLHTTTNISFGGISSDRLIMALQDIAVSSGSACSAVTTQPSHVLKAMGLTDDEALGAIRFSLGRFTTEQDIDAAAARVKKLVDEFRK
jgi:cysteine desulfurase